MIKHLLAGVVLAVGLPGLASAVCVAPTTQANLLENQKWAFLLENPRDAAAGHPGFSRGIVGYFSAIGGGWVNFVETLNMNGNVYRQLNTWGRWTANAQCTGGTLKFRLYYVDYTFRYTLSGAGMMTIRLIEEKSAFSPTAMTITDAKVLRGDGKLLTGPMGCPAAFAANPLNLINGMKYDHDISGAGFRETGRFSAYIWNPAAYSGALSIDRKIVAVPGGANIANMMGTSGRYIIYSDCSGGELLFNANGYARQLEFVFSKSDFSEMFLLEDGLGNPIVTGTATKVP